jgi:DNA-binding NarL/FixJ family response regulator
MPQFPECRDNGAAEERRRLAREVRVLIVDPYPLARTGLRRALEEHPNVVVVGDARNASEALDLIVRLRPDVILMDLQVPAGGTLLTPRLVERLNWIDERDQIVEALTERESEVLRLVATGARNRDIADQLVITENTVKRHVGQIHAKLGVRTRTEAVARSRHLGLLPIDDLAVA